MAHADPALDTTPFAGIDEAGLEFLANVEAVLAPAHALLDARLAVGAADERWEVALWARNLTDNQHVVQGLDVASLGFGNRTFNAPRTYGVTGTFRF